MRKEAKTLTKSIFKNLKNAEEQYKITKLNILEYGYPESKYLRIPTEKMRVSPTNPIVKNFIENLKYTAAANNVFSLSSAQVKGDYNIFCIHKDLSAYKWINRNRELILNPNDYRVFVNAGISKASNIFHHEYEECMSFKYFSVKCRRPLGLKVFYHDEAGKFQEEEIYDFQARVFHHELDHNLGKPMIHWKSSEGEIEIKDEYQSELLENVKYVLEYYRNRLRDVRKSKPESFEYFQNMHIMDGEENTPFKDWDLANNMNISFEDTMLVDIEKAIRKDLKLKLKQETRELKI